MTNSHTLLPRATYQACFVPPVLVPRRCFNEPKYIFPSTLTPTYVQPQCIRACTLNMLASRPFVSRIASGALRLIIQSLCSVADDLRVDIDASSNFAMLTGKLNGVSVRASRIEYNGFRVSGGAALYTDEISVTTKYSGSVLTAIPRLAKPFSVSIRASLTERDLNRPGPVRDALEMLLRQTIATGLSGAVGRHLPPEIGGVTCVLDRVDLSDGSDDTPFGLFGFRVKDATSKEGKLILRAHATLSSGRKIFFAVRTGLTTINDGNVLRLSDPELLWRNFCLPMVTIDLIGVKFDVTTKLTDVRIEKGAISGDGIMVISPPPDGKRRLTQWVRNKQARGPQYVMNNDEIRILAHKSQATPCE